MDKHLQELSQPHTPRAQEHPALSCSQTLTKSFLKKVKLSAPTPELPGLYFWGWLQATTADFHHPLGSSQPRATEGREDKGGSRISAARGHHCGDGHVVSSETNTPICRPRTCDGAGGKNKAQKTISFLWVSGGNARRVFLPAAHP